MTDQFSIEYDNDTGPNDKGFCEWWSVKDDAKGEVVAKCDNKEWAKIICEALNAKFDAAIASTFIGTSFTPIDGQ